MEGTENEVEGTSPVIDEKQTDEKLMDEQQQNTIKSEIPESKPMTLQVVVTHPLSSNGEDETQITSTTSIPPSPSASFLTVKPNSGSPSSRRPSRSDDSFAFRSRRNTKNDSANDNRGIYSWGRGGEGQVSDFYNFSYFSNGINYY